jgi:hypothetical protein
MTCLLVPTVDAYFPKIIVWNPLNILTWVNFHHDLS